MTADGKGHPGGRPQLDLYVGGDCPACAAARDIAARARQAFPGVNVAVLDLDVSSITPPAGVVAVPTFVLDGQVISLGTPRWDEIESRLNRAGNEEPRP